MKFKLFLLVLTTVLGSACEIGDSDLANILKKMGTRKAEVERFLLTGQGNQRQIDKYFSSFNRLVEAMEENRRNTGKKISYIGYFGAEKVCTDLFLAPGLFSKAQSKCGQGIRFLTRIPCESPKWLDYKRNAELWFDLLDERTQGLVRQSEECRVRLADLGVSL